MIPEAYTDSVIGTSRGFIFSVLDEQPFKKEKRTTMIIMASNRSLEGQEITLIGAAIPERAFLIETGMKQEPSAFCSTTKAPVKVECKALNKLYD